MSNNPTMVAWFEIPVSDMNRAIRFYNHVFHFNLSVIDLGVLQMAGFPSPGGGALVAHPQFYQPSDKGVLLYIESPTGDIQDQLDRIEEAGGKVLINKREVSKEFGYMGLFIDSEGNRIALKSNK